MLPWGAGDSEAEPLALHRLRLSATSLRLQWCAPIGLGLGLGPASGRSRAQAGLQPSLGQPRPAHGQPTASLGQLAGIFWLGGHTDLAPPHRCGQPGSQELGTPLPVGLTVDGVRIEIGRAQPDGL